jgi:hypothetical protein
VIAHKGRKVLLFCLHHGIQHMAALQEQGWTLLHKEAKKK